MRAAPLLIGLAAAFGGGFGPRAGAIDVSLSGFFSQRFDVDTNPQSGSSHLSDPEYGTFTDLGVVITARTPTLSFSFAPGVNFTASSDEDAGVDNLNPRFNGRISRSGRRLQLGAGLSVVPSLTSRDGDLRDVFFAPIGGEPTDPADPLDPGVADPGSDLTFRDSNDETALEIATRADLSASYAVDPRNSVNASLVAEFTRYPDNPEDFTDSDSFGVSLGWSTRIDPRSSVSLNGGARQFQGDGTDQTLNLGVGFSRTVSNRLSFNTNLGVTSAQSDDGESDASLSFSGGAGVNWRGPDYSLNANLSQGVVQDEFGELQNRASLSLGASHQINRRNSVSFPVQVSLSNPVFGEAGDEITFSTGPSFSHLLTDKWALNAGYRFSVTQDDADTTSGSLFFVQVSYNFNFLR